MSSYLSRRSFVRAGALLSGVAAASRAHSLVSTNSEEEAVQGRPSPIRLGIASYTFRNFTRTQMIGYLKQLHVADLNAKDVKDHLPGSPEQESAALEDYAAAKVKLHAVGAIYFTKDDDADIRSKFEYCKRAGVPVIVAGDPSPDTLPRVERFAKDYDIRIAIHNHGPEDKLWQSPLDILKVIQKYDARIGCCIDVGHTVRAGTDVVEAIREVGSRLFNIHMKDLTDFHDKESQVPVGEGRMPVRGIFEALIATGYTGFVDLEYEVHADDPMPGVIGSMAYMRGVLSGMGYRIPT